jgi:hypothetical protein
MPTLTKATNASLRIIAEETHGHWSARLAHPSSHESYGGANALDAVRRLIANFPQWGVSLDDFEPDWDNCSTTRIEMVFVRFSGDGCPDCGGTGKYVGLNLVEACLACVGTGVQ